jgi:4-hydroxy-tetrahydrodipicolinate synthase
MTLPVPVAGLFAAVPTPVLADGGVDLVTLDRLIDFMVGAGVSGICIGGATGEYPHFETADRLAVVQRAAARLPRDRALLVGIGAPSMRLVVEMGEAAIAAGSRALLLPMPMFFRYEQQDLEAFCAHASRSLRAPCLLYNLPAFTNALEPATIVSLLKSETFLVGIKDSSGDEDNLAALALARTKAAQPWSLLVGDDRLLLAGLQSGWDGAISGVAAMCPELLVALHQSFLDGKRDHAERLQALLQELLSQMMRFPTPWAIRIGLAARGYSTGPLPLPSSARRQQQIATFTTWLQDWLPSTGLADTSAR